jgi:hypothetical protein
MASPPIPPSLDHLATRPFSFYPAIINIEHNEWLFRKASWSEILVVNCKSGAEIWIPRRFVGEVSRVDDPVLIVGLNREIEYRGGMVLPVQRRVIEMPVAVGGTSTGPASDRAAPAPIVGIRLQSSTDTRAFRLIGGSLAVAILVCLLTVILFRVGEIRQRVVFTPKDQTFLDLSSRDDRTAVVGKLGPPANDRFQESGTIEYEALVYPDRKFIVILMGRDRQSVTYIGTMDQNWHPVHSISLHSGGTTASLLRGLKRF